MGIDHRGLNAFLNVARLGSVGAAATALSLTQPAVSRTLRKLEQHFACRCQFHGFRGTVEQLGVIGLLKLPDLRAHCRLRAKHLLSGLRKTPRSHGFAPPDHLRCRAPCI